MKKIIISGGGTGGHIFPAIAIARALQRALDGAVDILFVGAKGKMEMEKVPEAGFPIKGVDIAGIQRSFSLKNILKNMMLPFKMLKSMRQTRKIFNDFSPDAVVGVGGFASWTSLQCAAKRGIPYLIQEQNSYAGVTNKRLALKASAICVAYDKMERFFPKEKIIFTGNPVRPEVIDIAGKREEALRFFNLSPDKKTLLVIGGSLGASSINKAVEKGLTRFCQAGLQVIWQTGKLDVEWAISAQRHREHGVTQSVIAGEAMQSNNSPVIASEAKQSSESQGSGLLHSVRNDEERNDVQVVSFIKRMDLAYAAADVIVSRAGAIAISELCHIGKPTVFVPFPYAAENHQYKNAQALVEKQAARLIPDAKVSDELTDTILSLLNNEPEMTTLSKNIKALAVDDADGRIAKKVSEL
ncbi:MAG: UDP-N-acetylglucosamine--N-acetylmuramyl-(pentapeptide) pyrophosphoryl-undecaprenol N-acetylglucosamine transferase [Bacteroidales bacterium]|nr:UDP-N-acetylglucosamine--N-acetylmuramyl-(pentapeptide) pyrophosphoryl-undecaprenol N-acetylglucosamine transferase [Bacteroidales bacterium]